MRLEGVVADDKARVVCLKSSLVLALALVKSRGPKKLRRAETRCQAKTTSERLPHTFCRIAGLQQTYMMSTGKRPASGSFSSSQMVVKRPNLGNDKAVAVVNGAAANGALIQSVCQKSESATGNALNF